MNPTTSTVSDTHAILWFLFDPNLLTPSADAALQEAQADNALYIATITLVELDYIEGKQNFPYPGAKARIEALLLDPSYPLHSLDLDVNVATTVPKVPRGEVPEMPDRVISSTAVAHSMRLVSADHKIRNSPTLNQLIPVIW